MSEQTGRLPISQSDGRLFVHSRPVIPRAQQPDEEFDRVLESMAQAERVLATPVLLLQEQVTREQARLTAILRQLMQDWYPGSIWMEFRAMMYDWARGSARYIWQATPQSLERLINRLKEVRRQQGHLDVTPTQAKAIAVGQLSFEWPDMQDPQQ